MYPLWMAYNRVQVPLYAPHVLICEIGLALAFSMLLFVRGNSRSVDAHGYGWEVTRQKGANQSQHESIPKLKGNNLGTDNTR